MSNQQTQEKELQVASYYYQPLFDLMLKEHGIILLQSEMDDVISVVNSLGKRSDNKDWVEPWPHDKPFIYDY